MKYDQLCDTLLNILFENPNLITEDMDDELITKLMDKNGLLYSKLPKKFHNDNIRFAALNQNPYSVDLTELVQDDDFVLRLLTNTTLTIAGKEPKITEICGGRAVCETVIDQQVIKKLCDIFPIYNRYLNGGKMSGEKFNSLYSSSWYVEDKYNCGINVAENVMIHGVKEPNFIEVIIPVNATLHFYGDSPVVNFAVVNKKQSKIVESEIEPDKTRCRIRRGKKVINSELED